MRALAALSATSGGLRLSLAFFSVCVFSCYRAYELIMSETKDSELFIYPNPAKEKVTIEGIEATEVKVYNALGQRVKMVRSSNEINVIGLPEGVIW